MRNFKHIFQTGLVLILVIGSFSEHARVYASGIVAQAYNLIQDEGTPLTKRTTINFTGAGIACGDTGTLTNCNVPSASSTQQHVISFTITGGGVPISTGDIFSYPTAAFSCTINRTDISSDVSGSITVDIWKRSAAIPTAANIISASAPITLSSAQLNQNGSITGWTTTVNSGDVFGASVASVSTVTKVTVQIWCL